MDAADEAGDPVVAWEPALVRVGAAEEAARLEKERVEALRVAAVDVEEGESAEACSQPDPFRRRWECRQDLVCERTGVARRRRVGLVPVDRAEQGCA